MSLKCKYCGLRHNELNHECDQKELRLMIDTMNDMFVSYQEKVGWWIKEFDPDLDGYDVHEIADNFERITPDAGDWEYSRAFMKIIEELRDERMRV